MEQTIKNDEANESKQHSGKRLKKIKNKNKKLTVNSLCERMVLLRKTECKHTGCDSL